MTTASNRGRWVRTPEYRAKVAENMRRFWETREGPAPNLGVTLTAETRRRMSASRTGKPCPWNFKHGMVATPTHNSWRDMKARCYQPGNPSYDRYGARGITVCAAWMTFEGFLADMGVRPAGHTLDRVDNDGNYEPGNCRWATAKEQAANRSYPRRRKEVSQVDASSN